MTADLQTGRDVEALLARLRLTLPGIQVDLRTETPADLDFSASLYALTRAEDLRQVTDWNDEQKAAFCRWQFDSQHAHYVKHYPTANLLIVLLDGAPAGRLYFTRTEVELRLMEITLLERCRNRGIGGAISGALVEIACAADLPTTLHVEPFNPARRLYERQGFREVETRGIYLFMRRDPTQPSLGAAAATAS